MIIPPRVDPYKAVISAQTKSWQVRVTVPESAPDREGLFSVIADAVYAWEQDGHQKWDVVVATGLVNGAGND